VSTIPSPAGPRRAAVAFIFITVLLDVIGMGMVIPVLPKLVEHFMHGDTAAAARLYGLFATVWALMQLIAAPILGSLSDRYGRRRVILLSCFGLGLDYLFMALAPSVGWLFVGRVISGITAASFPTALAYIADVTPPEKRAQSFGIMGAAFGSGFILGPAIGGMLGAISPRLPFWAAGGMAVLNALYGYFVLPESLDPAHRRPFDWKRANPVGSLAALRTKAGLLPLSSVYFLYMLAHMSLQTIFVLYTGHRYGWDTRTVGLSLAVVGVGAIVVQGMAIAPMVRRFGERRMLLTGIVCAATGMCLYGLAPTGAWFFAAIPIQTLMFFTGPPLQGLMSRRVGRNEQGLLQGVNSSLMGIAGILGPPIFTQVFAMFLRPRQGLALPGAPYFLGTVVMLGALTVAERATRGERTAPSATAPPPEAAAELSATALMDESRTLE
jgi:DHA1 family tetracycline resistance protein-like MFS transporter